MVCPNHGWRAFERNHTRGSAMRVNEAGSGAEIAFTAGISVEAGFTATINKRGYQRVEVTGANPLATNQFQWSYSAFQFQPPRKLLDGYTEIILSHGPETLVFIGGAHLIRSARTALPGIRIAEW